MKFNIKQNHGFTLIELMIATLISSITIGSILLVYQSQNESYHTQEQVVEMQQNLRAALFVMIQEIRMAGFDPTGEAGAGIVATGDGSHDNPLTFTILADENGLDDGEDNDKDGSTDEGGELKTIRYDLYESDGIQKIGRRYLPDPTSRQPVAENIDELDFVYMDEDGNVTTTPADVRSVQITVIARSKDPDFTDTKDYRNQQNTIILDHTNYEANNETHFRRRMLSYEIKCRNLGL